jgi:G3E family GTPase
MIMTAIPSYILSGFLGSGKTTLLINILKHCKENHLKPAIILNELGSVNVESHLFEDEQVFELLDGCICCTIQDDLKETLMNVVKQHEKEPVDLLLIEGTGVANPLELVETMSSSPLLKYFELRAVISLIDANTYVDNQSIFTSKTIRNLLESQIKGATTIVLNKVDLVTDKQMVKVETKLAKYMLEGTKVLKTSYGNIDIPVLLEKRISSAVLDTKTCGCNRHTHEHGKSCNHHHEHHAGIRTMTIQDAPNFTKKQLKQWLKSLPEGIIRAKGYVKLEQKQGLYHFQYSSNQIDVSDQPQNRVIDPCIVLIGKDIDITNIPEVYGT